MATRQPTERRFGYGSEGCFCSRCCGPAVRSTCSNPHNHAVIYIDTGSTDDYEWLCNECFDKWIDSLIAQQGGTITLLEKHPTSPALVDGDTVTIDGIEFTF